MLSGRGARKPGSRGVKAEKKEPEVPNENETLKGRVKREPVEVKEEVSIQRSPLQPFR